MAHNKEYDYGYRRSELGRAAQSRARRKWEKQNSHKRVVQHIVARAIKAGQLIRPTMCEQCLTVGPVEAHHEDYSKPLEVAWLCRSCHQHQYAGIL